MYLRGCADSTSSQLNYEGYYDWKWVDIRNAGSAVVADLQIDRTNLGTLKVAVKGPAKETAVAYLPLDDEGRLPLPGALYRFGRVREKIKNGEAVIHGLREGMYRVAIGPWKPGARGPDGKTVLQMLPSATADVDVKRGTVVEVGLTRK